MNIIYSSSHFWVLAYPAQQSFELFDKFRLRTLFLHGGYAAHFCHDMESIPDDERDETRIDALLDNYCIGALPIVFH